MKKRWRIVRDKRFWGIVLTVLVLAASVTGIYIFKNTTYEYIQTVTSHENGSANGGNYMEYAGGVLVYSRDGVAMLTKEGKEIWNQPCQISNPMAEICKEAAVVADQGGTNIYVFKKDGLKGEIQTTRPVERVTVSAQGIVAAILQDEENPKVMCYDAKGNVLVENKASLTTTGYPVAIDLSQDGKVLIVSYLYTNGTGVVSKVVFYHFGETGEKKEDYQVAQKEYADTIIPTAVFLDQDTSLFVTDQSLVLYEGLEEPKEKQVINLNKEIRSIAYNEKYIALVLKNSGETGYELRMYRVNGKQLMSVPVEGEYANIKISKGQVLLYDESKCAIFNNAGVCKYKGTLEMHVLHMFAVTGLNKYMVISTNGFQEIQLVK